MGFVNCVHCAKAPIAGERASEAPSPPVPTPEIEAAAKAAPAPIDEGNREQNENKKISGHKPPSLLPLAEIIRLIDAIAGASPIVAPGTLRHGIATMRAAGHSRGETLETLLPALPLGCDAEAVRIAAWDGETPPIEAGRP